MKRNISLKMLPRFKRALIEEEKSRATVEKYMHDVGVFLKFANSSSIDKNTVIEYKSYLIDRYAVTSANSMLSALNEFFRFLEWGELVVRKFRVQKDAFCPEERELIRHLSSLSETIVAAAKNYDPAKVTHYCIELATCFHKFYNACKVNCEDEALMQARLSLCLCVKNVLNNILTMFSITVPESM